MKPSPVMTAEREQVAAAILKARDKKTDVIYTLGRWCLGMAIIRAIPEPIFKKLSL